MKKISLLLPTRGRRDRCIKFLNSVYESAEYPEKIEIVICVDDDDVESHAISHDKLTVKVLISKRQTMGKYNTDCLKASTGEIIFLVNDDIMVKSKNWDTDIRVMDAEFPDGIYLAYPNDMFKKSKQPTFPIISKKFCDLVKNPFPVEYKGSFIEYHLLDIFMRLKKRNIHRTCYLDKTIFEHEHYRTGKSEYDKTYEKRERFGDDKVFIIKNDEREKVTNKILLHLDQPPYEFKNKVCDINEKKSFRFIVLRFLFQTAFYGNNIPYAWRFFLVWWFSARTIAKVSGNLLSRFK